MIELSGGLSGQVFQHSILKIDGFVTTNLIQVDHVTISTNNCTINYPVVHGEFLGFIRLQPGWNTVQVQCAFYTKSIDVKFSPKMSQTIVQPLYILCADDDGHFQSPEGVHNNILSAQHKIALGIQILQTFVAHALNDHGFGYKTFDLPLDAQQNVIVRTHRSSLRKNELYKLNAVSLWSQIAKEIVSSTDLPHPKYAKYLAVVGCTRYDGSFYQKSWRHRDKIAATLGYINLGGGGLALIGSAALHTWPSSLAELVECFTDDRIVDQTQLLDDSAYRGTYWANFASSLGGALHELCHTMDLHHTDYGIMARGFDNIHKFFVLEGAKPVAQNKPQFSYRLSTPLHLCRLDGMSKTTDGNITDSSTSVKLDKVINTCMHTPTSQESHINAAEATPTTSKPDEKRLSDLSLHVSEDSVLLNLKSPQEFNKHSDKAVFAPCSAVMLAYSQWISGITADSLNKKPTCTNRLVTAESGIMLIELHSSCLDKIVFYQTFNQHSAPPTTFNISELGIENCSSCDIVTCLSVHVRDACGYLLKIKL